ncbi:unnamed protein product, partial [Rotaria magnacalcarata]
KGDAPGALRVQEFYVPQLDRDPTDNNVETRIRARTRSIKAPAPVSLLEPDDG